MKPKPKKQRNSCTAPPGGRRVEGAEHEPYTQRPAKGKHQVNDLGNITLKSRRERSNDVGDKRVDEHRGRHIKVAGVLRGWQVDVASRHLHLAELGQQAFELGEVIGRDVHCCPAATRPRRCFVARSSPSGQIAVVGRQRVANTAARVPPGDAEPQR